MKQFGGKAAGPDGMMVRIGRQRMRLAWRPRKRMPGLLKALLRRSMQALAAALLAGLSSVALAQVSAGALPTGGQLVAGQAVISQLNNQMRVNQSTDRAIINWNTFNIGSAARVEFQMPASTSAVLNRVITNDPSALLGTLTGNGRVWLINPAGIMVGAGATIDVAGFIGSTLNIRNEDFLAGRLNFSGHGGIVSNLGRITTPEGGNVYLVGSHVDNQGLIQSSGGEVLLAAGQTVELADTATPGVRVAITGTEGNVVNLGTVLAEAGRVGLAGVLVRNSGTINASSVVREGGRVFLRAAGSVIADAGSVIDASGTTGGDIRLIGEKLAQVDGALVARGTEGAGGFVETSGKETFAISSAPDVGPGGEWLIDPNNISIRAAERANNMSNGSDYTSIGDDAVLTTDLLQAALNAGTNVSITTTAQDGTEAGDINVFDAIVKSAGGNATLTLNAQNNINLNQSITATQGRLNVALSHAGTAALRNSVALNGGNLTSNGRIMLAGATLTGVNLTTSGVAANSTIVTDGQTRLEGGSVWNNHGTVDFMNDGSLLLDQGTHFGNQSDGTVNLHGNIANVIASAGGIAFNAGTLNKLSPDLSVLDEFSNATTGVVNVRAGALRLTGNGNHGGAFNLVANATDTVLDFAPGQDKTATLEGVVISQQSLVEGRRTRVEFSGDEGGTTILNSDLVVDSARMTGGTLAGSGRLAAGEFDWSGGILKGRAGDPAWEFTNLKLGGYATLDGRTLNLAQNGQSMALGGTLAMRNGARFNNAGTFTIGGGTYLGAWAEQGTGLSEINNAGILIATGNPVNPATNFIGSYQDAANAVHFNNSGVVEINDSPLHLGPGQHAGRFEVNATSPGSSASLVFGAGGGGITNLNPGAELSQTSASGGNAQVQFGSFAGGYADSTVNINTDISLTNALLERGVLAGSGKLRATNFTWSGGEIRGAAGDPAFDVTNLSLSGSTLLHGRTLNLVSGGTSRADLAWLQMQHGAGLNLHGTLSVASSSLGGYAGEEAGVSAINNFGQIHVAAAPEWEAYPVQLGNQWHAENRTDFNNAGTVDITDAMLQVGPGNHSGRFNLNATLPDGVTEIRFGAGYGSTTYLNPGTQIVENIANGARTRIGLADWENRTYLNTDLAIVNASLDGGEVRGTGALIATNFDWAGGVIGGEPGEAAFQVKNLRLSGVPLLDGRTLNLGADGKSTIDGGLLWMSAGAQINNAGEMTLSNGSFLGFPIAGEGNSEINNSGTIISIADPESRAVNAIGGAWHGDAAVTRFNNLKSGTVIVRDSTLELGPGSHQGSLQLNATAPGDTRLTFYHQGGVVELNAGTTITETRSNGGTTHVQFGDASDGGEVAGTTMVNTNIELGNASLAGGVLAGSGSLKVHNFDWTGGTIRGESLDAAFEVTNLHIDGWLALDGRTLNLAAGGTGVSTLSGMLGISNGGVLNSAGNLALETVDNAGTINVTGGALSTARIDNHQSGVVNSAGNVTLGAVDNAGTINISGGALSMAGMHNHEGAVLNSAGNVMLASVDNAGVINVSGGALSVAGFAHNQGSLLTTGSGAFTANGALGGSGTVQVAGGSLVLNGEAILPTLSVSSGTVRGTGSLSVTQAFTQSGGAINMPGEVSLHQQAGDLVAGGITAGNLSLIASSGAIRQTAALQATVLETVSTAGTELRNVSNRVGSFKAANSATGDIALINVTSPSSLILNGLVNTASNGNISIENRGGIVDNAAIAAHGGRVAMIARSPITVNAPISAAGNVSLQAATSISGNDNLTINSSVTSSTGSLQLSAGGQLAISSTGSLSVADGATISLNSVNGTITVANPASITGATPTVSQPAPVIAPPPAPPVTTAPETTDTVVLAATSTIVASNNQATTQTPTTSNDSSVGGVVPTVPATNAGSSMTASLGGQTVGGTAGTFGGAGTPAANSGTPSSTGSASQDASTPASEPSSSPSSSSEASSKSSEGAGSENKDEKKSRDDKAEPDKKQQTAGKPQRKPLPVCN